MTVNSLRPVGWPLVLAFGLSLASCGSGDAPEEDAGAGEPLSSAEVQSRAEGIEKPRPGLYRRSVELLEIEAPGMPEGMAEQMRGHMSFGPKDGEVCITEADTERGFHDMFDESEEGANCSYDRFEVKGGALDARMTCSTAGQGRAVMTMQGKAGSTASEVTMTMRMDGTPAPMDGMRMKTRMRFERIGDCGE